MYAATRFKYLLVEYGEIIALGFLLLAISGGGTGAWLYTHPQTETVTTHHNEQSVHLDVGTRATIASDDGLYAEDTTLKNRPFYLYVTAPNLSLHVQTTIDGAEQASISHRIQAIHKVVSGTESETAVYWQNSRRIAEETSSSGTEFTSTPILNITTIRGQHNRIANTVGSTASVSTTLRAETTYETGRYRGTLTVTIPITFSENSYSIPKAGKETSHSTTDTKQVDIPRPRWQYITALVVGGIGIVGLLFTIGANHRLAYSERRHYEIQRHRYSEWFSSGSVPTTAQTETVIELHSLEGLVDVAIDRDDRIIYDADTGIYVIPDTEVMYRFTPPEDNDL